MGNQVADSMGAEMRDLVLFEDMLDVSINMLDLGFGSFMQVTSHVTEDFHGLLSREVLDLKLMSDHI